MNRFFADAAEFSLVESLFSPDHFSRCGEGLGDDAFLFPGPGGATWALSKDLSGEGSHFRLDWTDPGAALAKALLSNLSDLNAMGAHARYVAFGLAAPRAWGDGEFAALRRALAESEARHGFRVVGGDTMRWGGPALFSITVLGPVEGKPLLRSGARPGQRIYVSGELGASAAGLEILSGRLRAEGAARDFALRRHFLPEPPLGLGPALARLPGAGAAIDTSDGLSSELGHVARQSGARLEVDPDALPLAAALSGLGTPEDRLRWALNGGEDYQLLFTGDFGEAELRALSAHAPVRAIGRVAEGEGVFLAGGGAVRPLPAGGWSHGGTGPGGGP